MPVIDADGHVYESEAMFALMEEEWYPRRPLPLPFSLDTAYGDHNGVWLIDGAAYPNIMSKNGTTFGTTFMHPRAEQKSASIPAQEMTGVADRLKDMDCMGIDIQVLYPTLFLTATTSDVKLEAALFRAYNTFLGDACSKSNGRIRFAAMVPVRDMDESVRELRRAKDLGAVAVMLYGLNWDMSLADERMCPLYAEANRLDVALGIHFGWGYPEITRLFDWNASFYSAVLPVLMGARGILGSGLLEEFPKLRVGFLETGSEWVPYVVHQLRRGGRLAKDPALYFREGRAFVACEADEDINHLVHCLGGDCLVVASDYPHADPSHEDDVRGAIMGRADVPLQVREKILSANPQRLYGL